MSLRLVVQPQHCIGCRSCELACAFTHGRDGMPGASRCQTLTVGKDEYVPVLCLQCDNAACAQVCPVGAITSDRGRGVLLVDHERCIRCMACTVACPFGNIHFDPGMDSVSKCDLCTGYGNYPRCAMFCPTKCLTVEQVEAPPEGEAEPPRVLRRPDYVTPVTMAGVSRAR
jgi:carbon-monoxide dehydrogenase iron sulfur subunit